MTNPTHRKQASAVGIRAAQTAFLDETIRVWQPYSRRPLNREDAREIAHNVAGFFRVLREWAEADRLAAQTSDAAVPTTLASLPSDGDPRARRKSRSK